MSSVSGILLIVKDLNDTVEFYKKLGFIFKEHKAEYAKAYLNWFGVEFVPLEKVEQSLFKKVSDTEGVENKGAGLFVHINVPNVDDFYNDVVAKRLSTSSEPRDFPWGRREFVIRDPDGYKIVFFQKLK